MSEIIKRGDRHIDNGTEHACARCGSVIKFFRTDVVSDQRDGDFVKCPVCGTFIATRVVFCARPEAPEANPGAWRDAYRVGQAIEVYYEEDGWVAAQVTSLRDWGDGLGFAIEIPGGGLLHGAIHDPSIVRPAVPEAPR